MAVFAGRQRDRRRGSQVVLNEEQGLLEDKAPALMGVAGYDGFYGDRF
ncbi:MAG: hypothetical protein ACFNUI_04760 [Negativicutes bacterium]